MPLNNYSIYQYSGNINYNERICYQLREILVNLIDFMQTIVNSNSYNNLDII